MGRSEPGPSAVETCALGDRQGDKPREETPLELKLTKESTQHILAQLGSGLPAGCSFQKPLGSG